MALSDADAALAALLHWLKARRYTFVTPTPRTHATILSRGHEAGNLRDVFGWNLPFARDLLPPEALALLRAGDALIAREDGLLASKYRVASCDGLLFLHSAFPTLAQNAVFFGPDSYRFVAFLRRTLDGRAVRSIVDIGAGSGVGGLCAAARHPGAALTLTDLNPEALRLARIAAAAADLAAAIVEAPDLDGVAGPLDVAVANPPYMIDSARRRYRDGGERHGAALSLRWAQTATARLAPGGLFALYTGAAIVGGRDALHEALADIADRNRCSLRYEEIDPDVWGEELATAAYADVERIAVVGATFERESA